MKRRISTRQLVLAGMLGGLVGVLGLTPLGMVPVPTPAGHATVLHVPVIIATVLEGPLVGTLVGFFFGAVSWWRAVTMPANPVAQVMFSDPVTAFGPRLLIAPLAYAALVAGRGPRARIVTAGLLGLAVADGFFRAATAGGYGPRASLIGLAAVVGLLVWSGASWLLRGESSGVALAAVVGTTVNTVGVLGMTVVRGILPLQVAVTVGLVHGLPEVVVGAALTVMIHRALVGTRLPGVAR